MNSEPQGCGVRNPQFNKWYNSWLNPVFKFFWSGPENPLYAACVIHDQDYELHMEGVVSYGSSKTIDEKFLKNMKIIIEQFSGTNKLFYLSKAYLYYYIVRIYGSLFWDSKKGIKN